MFVSRALLWAAPGKAPALRDALLKATPSGDQVIIAQRLWGDAPMFSVNRAFDSLAALEEWRRSWQPDPAVAQHFGRAPASELWEVPQALGTAPTPRFTVRWTYDPGAGKATELRKVVEQRDAEMTAAGRTVSVWTRVSGGPLSIAVVSSHDSLSSIEKIRAAALSDPAGQTYQQRLAPLLAAPAHAPDWFEILRTPA
jgi:hypothetical protein